MKVLNIRSTTDPGILHLNVRVLQENEHFIKLKHRWEPAWYEIKEKGLVAADGEVYIIEETNTLLQFKDGVAVVLKENGTWDYVQYSSEVNRYLLEDPMDEKFIALDETHVAKLHPNGTYDVVENFTIAGIVVQLYMPNKAITEEARKAVVDLHNQVQLLLGSASFLSTTVRSSTQTKEDFE